jgi:hypothetical protein
MLANRIRTWTSTEPLQRLIRILGGWLLIAAAAFLMLGLAISTTRPAPIPGDSLADVDPAQVAAMQAEWGIRITWVVMSANGGLIEIRYQVLDGDKALGIHDPEGYPVLIDEASGKMLYRGGGAHGDRHNEHYLRPGGTFYLMLQNNGSLLKSGSRVTVRIGEVKLEHVIVR